jgi:hypothetical protein
VKLFELILERVESIDRNVEEILDWVSDHHCECPMREFPGEPDAGNPPARFDEGEGNFKPLPTLPVRTPRQKKKTEQSQIGQMQEKKFSASPCFAVSVFPRFVLSPIPYTLNPMPACHFVLPPYCLVLLFGRRHADWRSGQTRAAVSWPLCCGYAGGDSPDQIHLTLPPCSSTRRSRWAF